MAVEVHQVVQREHRVGRVAEHDRAAGAEHACRARGTCRRRAARRGRSCRATAWKRGLRVGRVDDLVGRSTGHDEPPGITPRSARSPSDAAAEIVDQLAQREADARLVDARLLHVAAHAEEARAAVVEVVQRRELGERRRRPSRTRVGTIAIVSTLFTVVGQPNAPDCAGNGGLSRGSPRRPSSELSSAVSSPQMYAPAPVCT